MNVRSETRYEQYNTYLLFHRYVLNTHNIYNKWTFARHCVVAICI